MGVEVCSWLSFLATDEIASLWLSPPASETDAVEEVSVNASSTVILPTALIKSSHSIMR